MTRRSGFALLFSILLVLFLSLLAAGVVVVGTLESDVAVTARRSMAARARAEAAARVVAARWSTAAVRDLPPGSLRAAPPLPGPVLTTIERVDSFLYLIRTEARIDGGGRPAVLGRAGLLVRVPDRGRLESAFPAALTAETVARIDSGQVLGTDACATGATSGPGLVADSPFVAPGTVTGGAEPWVAVPPDSLRSVTPLDPSTVTGIATLHWGGAVATPSPVARSGECVEEPGNWGAIDADHPCHDRLPLVHAGGDLTLEGGEMRGILVVEGDLTLKAAVHLAGIVLVRGDLRIESDAHVRGAARAASIQMLGGRVDRDGCAMHAALDAPGLDRAFRPGARWWIPVF